MNEIAKLYSKDFKRRFYRDFGRKLYKLEFEECAYIDILKITIENEFGKIVLHIAHNLLVVMELTKGEYTYFLKEIIRITEEVARHIYHYYFSNKLYEMTCKK